MTLNLKLEYKTSYGQELHVVVESPKAKSYPMNYVGDGTWTAALKLDAFGYRLFRISYND